MRDIVFGFCIGVIGAPGMFYINASMVDAFPLEYRAVAAAVVMLVYVVTWSSLRGLHRLTEKQSDLVLIVWTAAFLVIGLIAGIVGFLDDGQYKEGVRVVGLAGVLVLLSRIIWILDDRGRQPPFGTE